MLFRSPLAKDPFFTFRSKLGVYPSPPTSLRGHDKKQSQNPLTGADYKINNDKQSAIINV